MSYMNIFYLFLILSFLIAIPILKHNAFLILYANNFLLLYNFGV